MGAHVEVAGAGAGPAVAVIFAVKFEVRDVVPTAQQAPVVWRLTLEKPADDWMKPGFDDSKRKEGPAGFGTLVFALLIWPAVQWSFKLFNVRPHRGIEIEAEEMALLEGD